MARLRDVFANILRRPDLALTPALTAKDVAGWDSVTHIALIAAVEKEFGVRFKIGEIATLRTVGDLITMIEKRRT